MKAIKKSTLLKLAWFTREYAKSGDAAYLIPRISAAKELAKQAYGRDLAWPAFLNFAEATIGVYALYPECTDEELCELFRALKFEVLDE